VCVTKLACACLDWSAIGALTMLAWPTFQWISTIRLSVRASGENQSSCPVQSPKETVTTHGSQALQHITFGRPDSLAAITAPPDALLAPQ
jgi:hypothetical protein